MVNIFEGLLRCGKSCRLRWINYLRPDLKRGGFTEIEEDQIIQLHARLGNRYNILSKISLGLPKYNIKFAYMRPLSNSQ